MRRGRDFRRSGLATMVAAAVTLVTLSGAAASSSRSQTIPLLRAGVPISVSSLDQTHFNQGQIVANLGLETLTVLNPDLSIRPWLAQSVTQPGAATYVYHLRHGVKFWDGAELTAADVVNSLNYNRYPGSQQGYVYSSVKSIYATDRYTVVVTLKHRDLTWPYSAASGAATIFEEKFQQAHKTTFGDPGTLVMGTGPWIPTRLDPTSGAELDANPHWWAGKPPIQHISVRFFADENSLALAFRSGAVDMDPFPVGDPRAFAATADTKLLTGSGVQLLNFFNMNTKVAPWNDVHVRRAVAYALNRGDLIRVIGGYASPTTILIPPEVLKGGLPKGQKAQVDVLLKKIPQYPFSLAKAKQELARSAYPNGFSTTLEAAPLLKVDVVSEAIAGQLQKVGINAKVDVKGVGDWITDLTSPDKRPTGLIPNGCLGPYMSCMDYLLGTKNAGNGLFNTANYTPPAVDALLTAGEAELNPVKRFAIYSKILTRVATDVPYVPLYLFNLSIALSPKFKLAHGLYPFWDSSGNWALEVVNAKG